MTTLAIIHAKNVAEESQLNTLLGQLGSQQTSLATAVSNGDMDAMRNELTRMWQSYTALNDAINSHLTEAQYETAVMSAIGADVVQGAVMADGSTVGVVPAAPSTSPAPGATDMATGQTLVTAGGKTVISPAPTGQLPVGTVTGLQPHPDADVRVPTEGDAIATANAVSNAAAQTTTEGMPDGTLASGASSS